MKKQLILLVITLTSTPAYAGYFFSPIDNPLTFWIVFIGIGFGILWLVFPYIGYLIGTCTILALFNSKEHLTVGVLLLVVCKLCFAAWAIMVNYAILKKLDFSYIERIKNLFRSDEQKEAIYNSKIEKSLEEIGGNIGDNKEERYWNDHLKCYMTDKDYEEYIEISYGIKD